MCFYCGSDLEEELGEEELGEEVLVLVRSSSQLQQEPEAELILRPCSSLLAAAALSSAVTHVFMVSRTRPSAPGLWSLLGCGDHVPSPVAFSESVLMVMNLVLVLVLVWSWIWSWLWAWSQTWLWAWSWSQSGPWSWSWSCPSCLLCFRVLGCWFSWRQTSCEPVPGAAGDMVLVLDLVLVLVPVLDLDPLVSMEMYNMYDSRDLLLIYCGRLVLFRCVRRSFCCRLCFCMFLITSFILVSVRRRTNTSSCVSSLCWSLRSP